MPSDVREKRNAIAALTLLVAVLAGADAIAAPEICGSDPAILTPLYPIRSTPSGPRLGLKPDITYTFEGQRPCSRNTCRIVVRHGGSHRSIASIRILSEEVTYCRNADPFTLVGAAIDLEDPGECGGGVFESNRSIIFSNDRSDSSSYVSMSWLQNRRAGGKSAFECRVSSSGEEEVFPGLVRVRTENQALLKLWEKRARNEGQRRRLLSIHRR